MWARCLLLALGLVLFGPPSASALSMEPTPSATTTGTETPSPSPSPSSPEPSPSPSASTPTPEPSPSSSLDSPPLVVKLSAEDAARLDGVIVACGFLLMASMASLVGGWARG